MSVYKTRILDKKLHNELRLLDMDIETVDGLVLRISNCLMDYISVAIYLSKEQKEVIRVMIEETQWLPDKKKLLTDHDILLKKTKVNLLKTLGDYYYDVDKWNKSIKFYRLYLKETDDLKVRCNIDLATIQLGYVEKGLKELESLYERSRNELVYYTLLKVKYSMDGDHDLGALEELAGKITPTKDEELDFLIWCHQLLGNRQYGITCYLQLKSNRLKFHYIKDYILYMMEKEQVTAMEMQLEPLIKLDKVRYLIERIQCHIKLGEYERGLRFLEGYKSVMRENTQLYIYRSICYMGLGQIINSVRSINKVEEIKLNESERESYLKQLSLLTAYSMDLSREHLYNKRLLELWKQKYRIMNTER